MLFRIFDIFISKCRLGCAAKKKKSTPKYECHKARKCYFCLKSSVDLANCPGWCVLSYGSIVETLQSSRKEWRVLGTHSNYLSH